MIARPLEAVSGTLSATGTCPICKGSFETCRCTSRFHQLVDRLVVTGDDRARAAGRRARRTLAEMAPGYTRQPVLRLTRPLTMRGADDSCPLCGYWTCRCGGSAAPASAVTALVEAQ
ncbi:hypothetical protein OG760_37605 (plasmid) [Streptomyces sp. NBC_00963]|nr:hypothetical protein OG760_37605 [Streptomyces sp. NBC_00963]